LKKVGVYLICSCFAAVNLKSQAIELKTQSVDRKGKKYFS